MAIGKLPAHVQLNDMPKLIQAAKSLVAELDEQHHVSLADGGWMEYISKEATARDSDNVLWQHVK